MATLRLREALQLGIAKVESLSDDSVAELRSALLEADLTVHTDNLAEQVALRVNSISRGDVDEIVETLSSLASIVASADVPLALFIEDVIEVVAEGKHPLALSPDGQKKLKARLAALLENQSIAIAAKARLVFVEHEHYLCYARIMTDVRPIFGLDVKQKPTAAMIVHSLKLVYHDGKNTKEFFVALDPSSLDRLSGLIERAKAKEETLKSVLGTADVQYLDTE